ncbi:MAG TPA: transcription termination/antitermination protein NusG [Clostridiales bacterium]|nr:transcription termination/antitermination protein NusG [Clostridiales bacterium]
MDKELKENSLPEGEDAVSIDNLEEPEEKEGEKADASVVDKQTFIKQEKTDKPYWYVVYTYSGYENKVMDNLLKTIENHNLQDTIIGVKVPMEESVEIKNGKKRHVTRKMFPGYVMVKMFLTDESWYVVRNTRGVTGFVGPSSKPIPLSDAEVRSMGIEDVRINLDVEVGNNVIVTSGPLESFIGLVEEVNAERQKVRVLVSMFGRDTSVELDFVQVKRI